MKKLLASLVIAFTMLFSVAAEDFINVTAGVPFDFKWLDINGSSVQDEVVATISDGFEVTGEYLHKFGDTPFSIGAKLGYGAGSSLMLIVSESDNSYGTEIAYDLGVFTVAPAFGFAWRKEDSSCNKKIILYPLLYQNYKFKNGVNDDNYKANDSEMDVLKFAAAFSWQWGKGHIQNGFEIGFNIDYDCALKINKHEFDNNVTGFGLNIAYKLSYDFLN